MSKGQSNVSISRNPNQGSNARIGVNRSKSVDSARARRREKNEMLKNNIQPKCLEDLGHCFHNGKLVSIQDGRPFEFNVFPNKEDNNRRYHAIGRLVDQHIYGMLEKDLGLRRIQIPIDPKPSEPTGFFFASDDITSAEYLMIIIHGMGVVRAGQWSRKLIMNENLEVGSQIEYIQHARAKGYAVIVTNTNLNTDESSNSLVTSSRPIRGSGSAEEHACYIWQKFVRKCTAPHICIMAHSYGGAVVLELADKYTAEFDKRVFAVALTDSPMKSYTKRMNSNVLRMLQKRTINWIADNSRVNTPLNIREYGQLRSAGHILHEWTSYTAFQSIFEYFDEERRKVEQSKR